MAYLGQVRVAAAHYAPVYMDVAATVDKACRIIGDAAEKGVQLIGFPESFIPGYPHWGDLLPQIRTKKLFEMMVENSLYIDGPEVAKLKQVARENKIYVSMGFSERTELSVGCLWNANIIIADDGEILVHHRKLVPTTVEKLIWARGDGAGLKVANAKIGHLGALVCGENTNTLARFALIAQGEQIHIASYPSRFARPADGQPYDIENATWIRAAAHSFEGKLFSIVVGTPFDTTARKFMEGLGPQVSEPLSKGAQAVSMIVGPLGNKVTPIVKDGEQLCVADIDLRESIDAKRMHDIAADYNRFDVFQLKVNMARQNPIELDARRE